MRLRKVFGALVVLGALEGCGKIPGSCEQDSDCGQNQFCHPEEKQCIAPRYPGLNILAPEQGAALKGEPVTVQAQLELSPEARSTYPSQLKFTVTPKSGGTPTELTQQEAADGRYSAVWTPPAGEGEYIIQVVSPEAGGLSAEVQVSVDRAAPSLAVQIPEAQPSTPSDGFTYTDPMALKAWRRDQTATVRVESDSADLVPTSLQVVVRGHNGGTDVTDLTVTPETPCNGKAYCGTVAVPLWRPGLEAFRGDFQVEVTAKDRAGNESRASGSIPVTRWKWVFDGASGPVLSTPSIGEKGTLYFGTSATNGKVFALNPEGTKKWETVIGVVENSTAVGRAPDGTDRIYVGATNGGSGDVYAFSENGDRLGNCLPVGDTAGPITTAIAITNNQIQPETAPVEAAYAIFDQNSLRGLRLDSPFVDRKCDGVANYAVSQPRASLILKEVDFYYLRGQNTTLQCLRRSPTSWAGKPGYIAEPVGVPFTGLGFTDDGNVVGAAGLTTSTTSRGGIFSISESSAELLWRYPSSFNGQPPVRNMVIGAGNVIIFGRDVAAGAAELTAIKQFATEPQARAPDAGSFPGAPVMGASNTLYTASATGPADGVGEVSAWSSDSLTLRWKLSDSVGRAQASPSLDCTRGPDGTPAGAPHGVLYVPATDGRMYAFVVDSPGLDKSAPWPKYQHDARNTGNPATPITNCP